MQREMGGATADPSFIATLVAAEDAGQAPASAPQPRRVALASGKGGVGKTWLSLTLAQALSHRRKRVLVFDADFGLANADIQIGHLPRQDLGAVIRDGADLAQCIIPIETGGFDLIAGRSGSGALAGVSATMIADVLARLAKVAAGYDWVLFDLGTGVDAATRQIAAHADIVALITTEDPSSLTDAYAVLKLLKRDRSAAGLTVDARIVVNQARSDTAGRRAHAALARAARGFLRIDPPLLGIIGLDERVADAIRSQQLLIGQFPNSDAATSVAAIARRLVGR